MEAIARWMISTVSVGEVGISHTLDQAINASIKCRIRNTNRFKECRRIVVYSYSQQLAAPRPCMKYTSNTRGSRKVLQDKSAQYQKHSISHSRSGQLIQGSSEESPLSATVAFSNSGFFVKPHPYHQDILLDVLLLFISGTKWYPSGRLTWMVHRKMSQLFKSSERLIVPLLTHQPQWAFVKKETAYEQHARWN